MRGEDLTAVIAWLEAGCDPAEAVKELRSHQDALSSQSLSLSEAREEIERLRKSERKAVDDLCRWRAAFQSFTPGGSEFFDPKAVREWAEGLKTQVFEANKRAVLAERKALENSKAPLADAHINPPLSDLSSLRKGVEVVGEAAAYDFVAGWHECGCCHDASCNEASAPAPASGGVEAVAWQYRYNGNWYVVDNEAFAKQGVDVTPLFAHPPSPSLAPAWTDVLAERRRQVEAEGWTPEHDDVHSRGEMAQAAAVYALCSAVPPPDRAVMDEFGQYNSVPFKIRNRWPWGEVWLKPKDRRSDLVRAAALILAEIERLDRKEGVR